MSQQRKLLSDPDAPYVQPLIQQITAQSKTTLANWAIDYCDRRLMPIWRMFDPEDQRPQAALAAARQWLAGSVKLPWVKAKILACHAAARSAEHDPAAQAAARAIGQSASTLHVARHSQGLVFYGALAIAYHRLGANASWNKLEPCIADVCADMLKSLERQIEADHPILIRLYGENDLPDMMEIWNQIVEEGQAFPQEEFLTSDTVASFFADQTCSVVAQNRQTSRIEGLYILHPNNIGRCGHIGNASYAVRPEVRDQHIGEKLVRDSLARARQHGFTIMQFNAVVATNHRARHLYERLGFHFLGTIPHGFRLKNGIVENICLYYYDLEGDTDVQG